MWSLFFRHANIVSLLAICGFYSIQSLSSSTAVFRHFDNKLGQLRYGHFDNEMVSLWDTAISPHILQLALGLWEKFHFGQGVFWVRSDLESRKKVRVFNFQGGVLGKVGLGLWEEFHFLGWSVLEPNPRTPGCSGEFGQKFLEA